MERLRLDVLVKGKNLKRGEIEGREIVEAYGGRVESLPILGEMTTDALLERIARQSLP